MLRRSFSRAAVALNGTTINPNVKAAKVRVLLCVQPAIVELQKTRHVFVAVERQIARWYALSRRRGTSRAS